MMRWWSKPAGVALALAALTVALGGGWRGTGTPVTYADHVPVTTWRLADIVARDADGRGVSAGRVTLLESTYNDQGGRVVMTTRWDEVCNQPQRFVFSWRFPQDITRVSKGQTISGHLALEADGGNNVCDGTYTNFTGIGLWGDGDGSGTPVLEQLNIQTGPNTLFSTVGKSGPFVANPSHVSHYAGPRTLQVDTRFNMHRAFFKLDLATRAGWFYEVVYLYEALPGDGSTPTGGGTTGGGGGGGGGGGPLPGVTVLGGLDIAAYCRAVGFPNVTLENGSWYCTANDILLQVEPDAVCSFQYSRDDALAQQRTAGDPQSWVCYVPSTASGGSTEPPREPNLPPPGCDVTGVWAFRQPNAAGTFSLAQNGHLLTGSAQIPTAAGSIEGTVEGNRIDFIVTWRDGQNTWQGRYYGTVSSGRITGEAYPVANPATVIVWSATGPTTCG